MISNKIEHLAKEKRLSLKEIGIAIGMTDTGFYQAMKRDDFKTSTLEKLSKYFKKPITFWFDDQQTLPINNEMNEPGVQYYKECPNCMHFEREFQLQQKVIDGLERELKLKKESKSG